MNKSRELLSIRYISIIVLFMEIFINNNDIKYIAVIFVLFLTLNNHLRIYYIKNEMLMILSLVLEIISIGIVHSFFGGNIIFYLLGIIIDTYTIRAKILRMGLLGLVFIAVAINSEISGTSLTNLVVLTLIYIFLYYIEELYKSKLDAQNLYDKLKVSEEKLIDVNEELETYADSVEQLTLLKERNRISRDIHDSVGHALSTAMIQLSAMESLGDTQSKIMGDMAGSLRGFINESFQDVKRAVNELKPDKYENYQGLFRLQEACKSFEKLSGIKVKTIISKGEWNLSTKQLQHLYRITQEVLSNALRHGKATKVNVVMNFVEDEFVISLKDNGNGVDKIVESGLGLRGIKERTMEMGGFVDMKSTVNEGFFIKVVVPREREI
ncbi:sensor histidine kinase [Clostridium vincentii]|uniref:histidine kinase n=1 Tax=Clostridium vincentii TaxID=52704 RepID=A0A2T0BD74_9CLOT|nr:sensor histidine kinase [Clostridium vincentii]PRR81841.1 Sensor histidine kinase LiaS [Clostridium vincentii]